MITKTIGTGGDYATIYAATRAFSYDVYGALNDDVTFNIISDVSEISGGDFTWIDMNGHTVRLTCNYNETNISDWQNWYKINCQEANGFQLYPEGFSATKTGTFQVDHIYVMGKTAGGFATCLRSGSSSLANFVVYNCFFFCPQGAATLSIYADYGGQPSVTVTIRTCLISGGDCSLITESGFRGTLNVYNTSLISNDLRTVYMRGTGTRNFTNTVSIRGGTTGDAFYKDSTDGTIIANYVNCACDDASITDTADSQTNCLENIASADEFVSLDDTNAEFLFPKSGGNIATGGIDAGYSTDIVGSPIPGPDRLYSIGCHEFQGTPPFAGTGVGLEFAIDSDNIVADEGKVTSTIDSVAINTTNFQLKLRTLDGDTLTEYLVCDPDTDQVDLKKEAKLSTLNAATTDTDKFLVSDSGAVKYRTGAEALSDIGAAAALSGTANKVAKFTSTTAIGDSSITDTGSLVSVASGAKVNIDNVTDATNGTDGSLQTDGGLSVAKKAYIGTNLTVVADVDVGGTLSTDGRILDVKTKTDTYIATTDDDVIVCNKETAMTVTLPVASGGGRRFIIKNIGAGIVTVDGDSSDTIDGETTQALSQWSSMQVVDYAANKWVIV